MVNTKLFRTTYEVKCLRFMHITPFGQMVNFKIVKRRKKFKQLRFIVIPAKFYATRRKWDQKRLKAYINVKYNI